jgi:hypothetical protein
MALIFADSFDHYSNAYIQSKWTSVFNFGTANQGLQLNNVQQRTGPQCGAFTGNGAFKTIKNATTWIFGGAFNWQQYGGGVSFVHIGTPQVALSIQNDGTLVVVSGPHGFDPGTVLGTTDPSTAITLGRYYYIEFKSTIHQSAGTVVVRINGQEVLNLAGVNTSPNGDNIADVVQVTGPGGGSFVFVDDLYVCDDSGTANTDFLGDVKIGVIVARAAGDFTQWTPSSGSVNFALVNEIPPDGDASYVSAVANVSPPDPEDTYFFQTVDPTITVLAIQTNIIARKDDEGNRALSLITRFGGVDSVADPTGRFANFTYIDYLNQFDVNPLTTLQWTPTSLNLAQWGYRLIA